MRQTRCVRPFRNGLLKRQVRHRLAKPRVLTLELLQPLHPVELQAASLRPPAAVRRLRRPDRPYRPGTPNPLHASVGLHDRRITSTAVGQSTLQSALVCRERFQPAQAPLRISPDHRPQRGAEPRGRPARLHPQRHAARRDRLSVSTERSGLRAAKDAAGLDGAWSPRTPFPSARRRHPGRRSHASTAPASRR